MNTPRRSTHLDFATWEIELRADRSHAATRESKLMREQPTPTREQLRELPAEGSDPR